MTYEIAIKYKNILNDFLDVTGLIQSGDNFGIIYKAYASQYYIGCGNYDKFVWSEEQAQNLINERG